MSATTKKAKKSDDQLYEEILVTLGRDWAYPEIMACAMLRSVGMRSSYDQRSHDNFFNDIDVDEVIKATINRFMGLSQMARDSIATYVVVACYESYQAGIERAKDAMMNAI